MPARAKLIKTRSFPVAYLQMSGVFREPGDHAAYDQEVLLAVRLSDFMKHEVAVRELVAELEQAVHRILTLSQTRRVVSLNQFEDVTGEDFLYLGILKDETPNLAKMRGRWRVEGGDAERGVAADEARAHLDRGGLRS